MALPLERGPALFLCISVLGSKIQRALLFYICDWFPLIRTFFSIFIIELKTCIQTADFNSFWITAKRSGDPDWKWITFIFYFLILFVVKVFCRKDNLTLTATLIWYKHDSGAILQLFLFSWKSHFMSKNCLKHHFPKLFWSLKCTKLSTFTEFASTKTKMGNFCWNVLKYHVPTKLHWSDMENLGYLSIISSTR